MDVARSFQGDDLVELLRYLLAIRGCPGYIPIDRADLVSGEFFYTEEEPASAHPAGFWKYKHPFAPAFEFKSVREHEESGAIEVTVGVEIDQGDGMVQQGLQTFLMRRSDKGYQVMPHKAPPFWAMLGAGRIRSSVSSDWGDR